MRYQYRYDGGNYQMNNQNNQSNQGNPNNSAKGGFGFNYYN